MTNSNVAIGNRNGVTVDETIAEIVYKNKKFVFLDLPGVCSFDGMTSEEEVTYARINNDRNATLIIVIDPTGISEQIYFLTKMLELYSDRRFLVVFGMADEIEKSGSQIYMNKFEQITGVPCISVSARKGTGISELIYKIYEDKFSRPFRKIKPEKLLECFNIAGRKTKIELYFDKFFLNKFFGTAFFFTLMFFVVYVSFGNIGNKFLSFLDKILYSIFANFENDFAQHCVFPVLECILSLVPRVFLLSVIVSSLDDCGYLSRVSCLFGEKLRLLGVDGKVALSVILGFGCTVPAILSLRTFRSSKERVRCILAMPFISCSARIPIMLWLSSRVSDGKSGIVWVTLIYLIGIVSFLIFLLILRFVKNDFSASSEKIKIPRLRIPYFGGIFKREFRNMLIFAKRILLGVSFVTVIMWFFGKTMTAVCDQTAFVFAPLGFGNGAAVSALVSGIGGKEMIVSSLATLGTDFSPDGALAFAVFSSLYLPCLSSIVTMYKELCREKKLAPLGGVKPLRSLVASLFFMLAFAYLFSYIARRLFLLRIG